MKRQRKRPRTATVSRKRHFQNVLPKGELKFIDVDLDDAVVASGGTITPSINLVVQGIGESQRIGRKITIKKINWRYKYSLAEINGITSPPNPDIIRIILYLDKQCNGAIATVLNILQTADFQSFRNLVNSKRFAILLDKSHAVNYATALGSGADGDYTATAKIGQFFKTINIPLEFSAETGAITELCCNNFGVLLISECGIISFESKIRLRYTDF